MTRRLAGVLILFLVAAGCGSTPPRNTWVEWGYAAIDAEFAPHGSTVLRCAHAIAETESHHDPRAEEPAPDPHHGLFQLWDGFWGSIKSAAAQLGRAPNWHDARQNARAALGGFLDHGTFHFNWPSTAPGWCP